MYRKFNVANVERRASSLYTEKPPVLNNGQRHPFSFPLIHAVNVIILARTRQRQKAERLQVSLAEQNEVFISLLCHDNGKKIRTESLYKLHKHGKKTWVSIEPYPTPNIIQQDIGDILNSTLW